jgi:hypothetical protein
MAGYMPKHDTNILTETLYHIITLLCKVTSVSSSRPIKPKLNYLMTPL